MMHWAAIALLALVAVVITIPAIWYAKVSFVRSLGWLLVHLAALGFARYVLRIPSALLMFFVPLIYSGVAGVTAGRTQLDSSRSRLWTLGACLPAAALLNIAAIRLHLDELGKPLGDNALMFVLIQIFLGLPAQLLILLVAFAFGSRRDRQAPRS